jgi:hypothetical protein
MVIFRIEVWEEIESKEVKEKGKNKQIEKAKQRHKQKKFQRYKEGDIVY